MNKHCGNCKNECDLIDGLLCYQNNYSDWQSKNSLLTGEFNPLPEVKTTKEEHKNHIPWWKEESRSQPYCKIINGIKGYYCLLNMRCTKCNDIMQTEIKLI